MIAVGHPPGRLILPRERPALPATREEALSLAANNNFNVISATFAELAARDNIDVVRGQLPPRRESAAPLFSDPTFHNRDPPVIAPQPLLQPVDEI